MAPRLHTVYSSALSLRYIPPAPPAGAFGSSQGGGGELPLQRSHMAAPCARRRAGAPHMAGRLRLSCVTQHLGDPSLALATCEMHDMTHTAGQATQPNQEDLPAPHRRPPPPVMQQLKEERAIDARCTKRVLQVSILMCCGWLRVPHRGSQDRLPCAHHRTTHSHPPCAGPQHAVSTTTTYMILAVSTASGSRAVTVDCRCNNHNHMHHPVQQ
jgi:hypothetical protein